MFLAGAVIGCGGGSDDLAPTDPKQAAFRLEEVFASSPPEARQAADAASEAMTQGEYERAVVSLQVLRNGPEVTMEQGLAIHHSAVSMEAKLISAMEAGDQNARRAYELLKKFKRN